MFTLTITDPDGNVTVNPPAPNAAQAAWPVALLLKTVAPDMTNSERIAAVLQVSRHPGRTRVHLASGYRFRLDRTN